MKTAPVLLALVGLVLLPAKESKPPVANDQPVELEPFRVHEKPIISYAIDIVIYADKQTKQATRMFITRVRPDTDAERAGLQEGDEIVKLEGQPVKGMDSTVSAGTPLGLIFLDRKPGAPIKLEVITRRTQEFTLRAQRGSPFDGEN